MCTVRSQNDIIKYHLGVESRLEFVRSWFLILVRLLAALSIINTSAVCTCPYRTEQSPVLFCTVLCAVHEQVAKPTARSCVQSDECAHENN
jgi:hypothetical protein